MVCILGMGDCGNKQEIKKKFNIDVLNKNISSQVSTNSQKVSASSTQVASLTIEIENVNEGCPVDVAQSIDATTVSDVSQVVENISKMESEVVNKLQQAASDDLKATGGFFATTKNRQSVEEEMNQSIKNIVQRTFKSENVQEVSANSISVATGKITIKNCNAPIKASQDIVTETVVNAVMDNLVENIANDTTLNEIVQKANTKAEAEAAGFFESIGNAFAKNTRLFLIIAAVVCLALVIIAIIAMSPGGQKALEQAPQAAASGAAAR